MTKSAQLRWKRQHERSIKLCQGALHGKKPVWHWFYGEGRIVDEWGNFSDAIFEKERLKNWLELSPEAKIKLPYNPEVRRISGTGVFDVAFRMHNTQSKQNMSIRCINADHLKV